MYPRDVGRRTSIRIVGTSRVSSRTMLFVLAPRDEAGTSDIVAAEVKDRKFREEASSRSMPVAIVEEDRTNATDIYDKDDVYARGRRVPPSGRRPEADSQARLEIRPTAGRSQEYVEFFCSAPTAGKRRIYYGRFHGISLDRPGPSEKTSGPPELIIRRVHTPRVSCICHWRGRGLGRVCDGTESAAFFGARTNDD